jgi:large subunit ribosomal protein L22
MSIDEAIKQLNFMTQKGAMMIKEALLEAQDMAVKSHNVEFKSNLWVAESFNGRGYMLKGLRRHARGRPGVIEYKHTHYFVRLEEGKPPKHFYLPHPMTPVEQLSKWMDEMRKRKVINSL